MAAIVLGLPEARRNEAAAVFRARGVPHRRIEEWKYSDLKSALGEGVSARWRRSGWSAICPVGVEIFDLLRSPIHPSGSSAFSQTTQNAMSAASLSLSASGVAFGYPRDHRSVELGFHRSRSCPWPCW